jgi:hypothetical protein
MKPVTESDVMSAYMRFRAQLDALQHHSLIYCSEPTSYEARIARMTEVEGAIATVLSLVAPGPPCVHPYRECGGVCVMYDCFSKSESKVTESAG